jgi:hypothetical protein
MPHLKIAAAAAIISLAGCAPELPPIPMHPTLAYCATISPGGDPVRSAWNSECVRRSFHDSFDGAEARYKKIYPNGPSVVKDSDRSVDSIIDSLDRSRRPDGLRKQDRQVQQCSWRLFRLYDAYRQDAVHG